MNRNVFEARTHYYAIQPGNDIYPKKQGMIDVRIYDSLKNKEVAVVAFNEKRPESKDGAVLWQLGHEDIEYFMNVTNCQEEIKNLAHSYLKSKGLNYD